MFLIIEILMLITGIWAIATGKVPSFLFGGGKYQIEGLNARLFGILLVLPLPLAFLGATILVLLFGEDGAGFATLLEIGIVIGVGVLALILGRVIGQPVDTSGDVEKVIAKKTQGALVYAIFSATGIGAIVLCPLAFIYANQALRLIDENQVGEKHRGKAKLARAIAAAFTALWAAVIICFISFAIS